MSTDRRGLRPRARAGLIAISLAAASMTAVGLAPSAAASDPPTVVAAAVIDCSAPTRDGGTAGTTLTVNVIAGTFAPGQQLLVTAAPNGPAPDPVGPGFTISADASGQVYAFGGKITAASWIGGNMDTGTSVPTVVVTVADAATGTVLGSDSTPVGDCTSQRNYRETCNVSTSLPTRVVISSPVVTMDAPLSQCLYIYRLGSFIVNTTLVNTRGHTVSTVHYEALPSPPDGQPIPPIPGTISVSHLSPGTYHTALGAGSSITSEIWRWYPEEPGISLFYQDVDWTIAFHSVTTVAKDATRIGFSVRRVHGRAVLVAAATRFNGTRWVAAPRGTVLYFERRCGCGKTWKVLASVKTNAKGRAALRWRNPEQATYRVVYPETRTTWSVTSASHRG